MWSVGILIVLCIVLASLWAYSTPAGTHIEESSSRTCVFWHNVIVGGAGGASPSAPTIRSVRLTNQGNDVLVFSKIGLYLQLEDATSNRIDLLEKNKASVQFYTMGLVASKGDLIDTTPLTAQSYATVSPDHYVSLPAETSLVIDLEDDVPITVVRMGAIESTTAPDKRQLLVETSSDHTNIANATFTPGFVRWLAGQDATRTLGGQASSNIGPSGIYEFASTLSGFTAFPTSISCTPLTTLYSSSASRIVFTFDPADGLASMEVVVYYHVTNSSLTPTQCGAGTVDSTGSATVPCTFASTGTFYMYGRVTAPNGTPGSLLCTTTTVPVLARPPSINFKTFAFASTSDAAAVTSTPTTFAAALPSGFASTATQTNLAYLKAYYRDINGEWAPVETPMVPRMVRMDYNAAVGSADLNARSKGYAVILVQCNTYRNESPTIQWSTYPSGTKTTMCSGSGGSYVNVGTAPSTALTFSAGVNSVGEVLTAVARQSHVTFANARVAGESSRWYNGIKEHTATVAFDGTVTQTPCLGAGGGVQLQDYVTVHQFSTSMPVSFDRFNNSTLTTVGVGDLTTTPYACNVATNRCGGGRFAEFAVVTANMAPDDLLCLASDYANRWRVPFAGPTVKTFRLINTGTASLAIGYVTLSSRPDASKSLLSPASLGAATYTVSSGSPSSVATWQGATTSTQPHQTIVAGAYLQVALSTAVENAGFVQLGIVTFATGAELAMDVQFTSGAWERYDLWYHYNGAAVNATTTALCPVGTGQAVYAKNGVFMPWKQKYRTSTNEDATMPYNLPLYNVSREGSAVYLATLSSNLLAPTWDGDRAVQWTIAQSRAPGATMAENQVITFKQHSDAAQQNPRGNFTTLRSLISTTTTDGKYNLGAIEMTRYDYLPASVRSQYVSYVSATPDTLDSSHWGRDAYDMTTPAMAFVDPVTMRAAHCRAVMNNERMDVNMRLRKSLTGKYYLDTPQTFDNGLTYIGGYRGYVARFFSVPLCRSVRSMFGLSAYDPAFSRSIDALDCQKKYTVYSIVCNTNLSFMGKDYSSTVPGNVMDIACGGVRASVLPPLSVTVASSVCTEVRANNIGGGAMTQTGGNSPLIPPVYRALRTCSNVGLSGAGYTGISTCIGDVVNYPNAAHERLFIVTVAVDTTVGGANAFNSDATMEQYVKVYINGKRINTAARRTANGSSYVTVTTSVGSTPGTTYPSYFYPSSALTYGITQIQDTTYRVSSGSDSAQRGIIWAEGMKYSMAAPYDATTARCFHANQTVTAAARRTESAYVNRSIIMEAKTESRATAMYSAAEIDAHIMGLSTKWGIVMAYRWVTIRNTGTVDFRFARLGFYASHSEAYADAAGTTTDQKMGTYTNIMKGYTTNVTSTARSATVGSAGITAVLSNTASAAPGALNSTCVAIQAGGSVTIDLGDPVTCSHLRFGDFASTGDVTLARMIVDLAPTLAEAETSGTAVTHVLKAALNNSGVAYGQFPLHSPAKQADTGAFVTASGAHVNSCGVYVLYGSRW